MNDLEFEQAATVITKQGELVIDVDDGGKLDFNWRKQDHRFICCGCGSVHRLRFTVAGEMMRIRAWQDDAP